MERHWAKTSLLLLLFFELDADFPKSHLNVLRVGRPSKIYNSVVYGATNTICSCITVMAAMFDAIDPFSSFQHLYTYISPRSSASVK